MRKIKALLILFCTLVAGQIPNEFVYLRDVDPTILQEIRYASYHNFVGRPINSYFGLYYYSNTFLTLFVAPECILTKPAARNLSLVQQELMSMNPPYTLKVYDCYR